MMAVVLLVTLCHSTIAAADSAKSGWCIVLNESRYFFLLAANENDEILRFVIKDKVDGSLFDSRKNSGVMLRLELDPLNLQWWRTTSGSALSVLRGGVLLSKVDLQYKIVRYDAERWSILSNDSEINRIAIATDGGYEEIAGGLVPFVDQVP